MLRPRQRHCLTRPEFSTGATHSSRQRTKKYTDPQTFFDRAYGAAASRS
jgi:hypothetical protein